MKSHPARRFGMGLLPICLVVLAPAWGRAANSASPPPDYRRDVRPVLETYCFDCHADGADKGQVSFDTAASDAVLASDHALWRRSLRNVRAGIMPPPGKPRPDAAQQEILARWIKSKVFQIHPENPDPGHVRMRRLNRVEYRNTIRDLIGVDFKTETQFPPDDTGFGFDTIGSVLTIPPMLLEKYLGAASAIIEEALGSRAGSGGSGKTTAFYRKVFPRPVPETAEDRRLYARQILRDFATRAFRRPVEDAELSRLTSLAEPVFTAKTGGFQAGVAQAMVAVLASPRFLFREEHPADSKDAAPYPLIDEYSLASRLSYFLWSSMPDEELFRQAGAGALRANISAQVNRMLGDTKSEALVRNFAGQWLRARDIESVPIEARVVMERERKPDPEAQKRRRRFRELNGRSSESLTASEKDELGALRASFKARERSAVRELTTELRHDMRRETEMVVDYVFREDRNLLELLDANYTFLNERLAAHYGVPGVSGSQMRRVELPADSPRGGVLTEGTILVATSNPTRTSPVKRGLFILDNILGTPAPAPPPNVPPLEAAAKGDKVISLRETLAIHRENPMCNSCHNRMDPLGLAFEHFNALGLWRDTEFEQPVDSSGRLASGEEFKTVAELKRVLARQHGRDFYRAVTEKLLTYALGRGLEDSDTDMVDQIVAALDQQGGRPSALLNGVVQSAAFQRCRVPKAAQTASLSTPQATGPQLVAK